MEAIILAGGLGTRLAARLQGIPKSMAPVAGRPFLDILLARLECAGCTRVLLSVGHLHQAIQSRFGTGFRSMTLDYVVEDEPLGTGGAIRAALAQATEEDVLVLNGDTYLQADYAAMMRFHAAQGAALTIAVTRQPDIARYGGVLVERSRIVGFEEKGRRGPGWINAGAYILSRHLEWPPSLPARFSFETDFLAPQIARLAPAAFPVDGIFLDIGIPEDLDRAQHELANLEP
jgi:D-glycero-alpha-D-manno-heptose 1-phosphate guanylyltransferase